jgi:hypothetical protein
MGRVKTCRNHPNIEEPTAESVVTTIRSEIGFLELGSLDRSPIVVPPPAILGRMQQEAVCHGLDQKLLSSDSCRNSLV